MKYFVLLFVFLAACSAEDFPDCCVGQDAFLRDAPFSTTYLFNFRTGTTNISAPSTARFLRIVSQPDILTLKNAASTSQLVVNGMIAGQVLGTEGPAREATLVVSDGEGNIVSNTKSVDRNFFYNSLGRVPDFLNDKGTGDAGNFTFFNAPPGELYFNIVRGGRGNGRAFSFGSSVSVVTIPALPVFPDKVGVLGVVSNGSAAEPLLTNATVSFFGQKEKVDTNDQALFILPDELGLPTEGEFLMRLSAPTFAKRDTVLRFNTDLGTVQARIQAFDPITADQLAVYTDGHILNLAVNAGISIDPQPDGTEWSFIIGRSKKEDGTGQGDVEIEPFDAEGNSLVFEGTDQRFFYFNGSADVIESGGGFGIPLDPKRTKTTDDSRFMFFIKDCDPSKEIFFHSFGIIPAIPEGLTTGRAVAHCDPGNVVIQDIIQVGIPVAENPPKPPPVTVPVNSKVVDEEGTAISGVEIQIIGAPNPTVTIDPENSEVYQIPIGNNGETYPILANSRYTVRTSLDENYMPTYQTLFSGTKGGDRDLTLFTNAVKSPCGASGVLNLFGTTRDLGRLTASRAGRLVDGISIKVVTEDGSEVGRIFYPGGLDETSARGEFLVCDLPGPGLYLIEVTTGESSAAILVHNYEDGVHLVNLPVNKALPQKTILTGQTRSLFGFETNTPDNVGNMTLSVRGSKDVFSSNSSGIFDLNLGTNGQYIIKLDKEGYLPSYNYQVETPVLVTRLPVAPLWTLSNSELESIATSVDVSLSPGLGTFAGQVVVRGFSSNTETRAEIASGVDFIFDGFFNEDFHADVVAISKGGEIYFFIGDGFGGLSLRTPACPNLPDLLKHLVQTDLNLDGRPDLIAMTEKEIQVYLGTREGCFEQEQVFVADDLGGIPKSFSLSELTDDSYLDILIATNGPKPLVQLENRRDGFFDVERLDGNCGINPVSVTARRGASGDLLDIIIADSVRGVCEITYNGNGAASPTIDLILPEGFSPEGLRAVNATFLDLDGSPDILVSHELGAAYFLNLPPTGDEEEDIASDAPLLTSFTRDAPFDIVVQQLVDINRDNRLDLILGGDKGLQLLLGSGDGSFGVPFVISSANISSFILSDLTEDGKIDIISQEASSLNLILGEDSPREGISLAVKDFEGRPIGDIFYLDAEGKISKDLSKTTESGRFMVFNLPATNTLVQVTEGGAGNQYVTSYAGSLSYLNLNMNPINPTTITIDGQVLNPTAGDTAGLAANDISITPLGTGTEVISKPILPDPEIEGDRGSQGNFVLELGATSEFIIKLDP